MLIFCGEPNFCFAKEVSLEKTVLVLANISSLTNTHKLLDDQYSS